MKKIAIFTCLKKAEQCIGCGCMKAFNKKTGTFKEYEDQEVELLAFFHCSHCIEQGQSDQKQYEAMGKKIDRLAKEGVQKVHIGICTKKNGEKCPGAKLAEQLMHEKGIETVEGTHPRHGNK